VHGQHELLEVVHTLRTFGGRTNATDRWEQKGDQDDKDEEDDEQFDKGKPVAWRPRHGWVLEECVLILPEPSALASAFRDGCLVALYFVANHCLILGRTRAAAGTAAAFRPVFHRGYQSIVHFHQLHRTKHSKIST
jgi:hypothetical protein